MCILIGFIAGMIVIHEVDAKNEKIKTDALKEEIREAKKPVNVYFPKRNIKYGEIPRNSYNPDNFVFVKIEKESFSLWCYGFNSSD